MWPILSAYNSNSGFPILLKAPFGKGALYILTIPENFSSLYNLPAGALNVIKKVLMKNMFVRTESPAKVTLFVYDNHTFVIHSFLPHPEAIKIDVKGQNKKLKKLLMGKTLTGITIGDHTVFKVETTPHHYNVFKVIR